MLLLIYFYCCITSRISVFVQGAASSTDYSFDSRSHISDADAQKYFCNATAAFNYHLIPDIIDEIPWQSCGMLYGTFKYRNSTYHKVASHDAHLGVEITPKQAKFPPFFEWYDGDERDYYTLMMFDIDAPNATQPIYRSWLNWLVVNSRGYKRVPKAHVLADYVGPWPLKGTGVHRYVGLVYMQPKKLKFNFTKIEDFDFVTRRNFDHRAFAKQYNFGEPICANFFQSRWEKWVDEYYKDFYSHDPSYFATKEILREYYEAQNDSYMYLDIPNSTVM